MIKTTKRCELISYPIRDIVQQAKALEKEGIKMIYLNIGDPCQYGFRPPSHVLEAAKEALSQNYAGYAPSEGDPELRAAVAEHEKVATEDVFITSGLSEGIDFLFQALVEPGTNILLPTPTYPLYLTKELVNYGTVEFYNSDEHFEPDIDDLRKAIKPGTRAILVINPNNPTGAVYSRKSLQGVVDVAGEHKLPIISDDVYDRLVFDGEMTHLKDLSKDVPIVSGNSLSKNYVYPGARVGYLAFRGEGWGGLKEVMQRLCNQRLSVNWEMQRAYIAALRGPHDHVTKMNDELRKRRDAVMKRVDEIEGLATSKPKGAFYAFIKIQSDKWKSDNEFVKGLLRHGVVVVPGSGFAPNLKEKAFRIVFLPPPDILDEAFSRIEKFMK